MENEKTETQEKKVEEEQLIPKQGHQVMLAAQSLFFRKLILEHRKIELEKKKE